MSEVFDDNSLLELINISLERNRACQTSIEKYLKIIPERILKVQNSRNLYIAQNALVEHLRTEVKPAEGPLLENAYFYRYSKVSNKPTAGKKTQNLHFYKHP